MKALVDEHEVVAPAVERLAENLLGARRTNTTSAVSMVVTPASRQMSSMRDVSATPRLPILPNRSRPPIVIVPKLSTDTLSPESPNRRCSMLPKLLAAGLRSGLTVLWRAVDAATL